MASEPDAGEVGVSAADPEAMLPVVGTPALDEIAIDAGERFDRVLDALPAEPAS